MATMLDHEKMRLEQYAPTEDWPRWASRLWRWLSRWRLYERGYVDGWNACEREYRPTRLG